ncbi:MAG: DUF1848 domain-containing protein [Acidobacteriota bacterium]
MIVSASRRTDIPAYYMSWFMNRVAAGWCDVPNPYNPRQVSRLSLRREDVEAFVFWTRAPGALSEALPKLDGMDYPSYATITVTAYPKDLEPFLPPLERRLDDFRRLSDLAGPRRCVWRYDPVILSNWTNDAWHRETFGRIARALQGHSSRVVLSYLDLYRKTGRRLRKLETEGFRLAGHEPLSPAVSSLMRDLAAIAAEHGFSAQTCAEEDTAESWKISPGRCIDPGLLNDIYGLKLPCRKDPGQRKACLCTVSRDMGIADTCLAGCAYCYATSSHEAAAARRKRHSPGASALLGV